ncbi:CAP domain-containing protein [Myxococcota bacterium]|nr:CAP domain-containing protein [Myxococcota bacterium]MBU1896699.1 CAP domain-containing protein [Myxococcota bacterium]
MRPLLFAVALSFLAWLLFAEIYEPQERALLLSRVRVALFEDAAGFAPVAPRYGEPLRVHLAEDPVTRYAGAAPLTDEDRHYAPLVREAGGVYDPRLAHAARELAGFYAEHQQLAPSGALAFILDAAGVVGWGVRQAAVITNAGGDGVLIEGLESQLKGRAQRVGVGEAMLRDRRVIVSLFVGEGVTLEPTPRAVEPGEPWRLRGRLKAGFSAPHLLVADPSGRIEERDVERGEDGAFSYEASLSAGCWTFELLAEGDYGPTPLTQLTIHVGEPLPQRYEDVWPRDERDIGGNDQAADRLFEYVNEDRARWGLPPLRRDPALDAIAAAHSEDMRASGFVGHRSPRTGLLGDRLRGYRAVAAGENVALNRSLWDAQAGLMRSLGHRRNLLSTELTHIGLGVAYRDDSGYITQVFARPAPVLDDIKAARRAILAQINAARRAPLRLDGRLQRAAQAEARQETLSPKRALERLSEDTRGALAAWTSRLSTLEQFEPEGDLLAARFSRVGVGLAQDRALDGPDIALVILVGE